MDRIEEAMGFSLAREDICLLASSADDELAIYQLSRALAADATILITTHAYTAISLARKALLGAEENPFDMLVVDEADQWASAASSVSLVSASMTDLHRSIDNVLEAGRHLKNRPSLSNRPRALFVLSRLWQSLLQKPRIAPKPSRPTTVQLVCWQCR